MRPSGPEEEVYCQNCGRYIGSLGRCPYCRTKSSKRLSYKLLKWGGLALAILGVIGVYIYALNFQGPPPTIQMSDLEPTMNFSIAKFENITVTGARYETSTGWLSIFIDNLEDNEGSMFVRAYDSETEALINRNNVPGTGQKVDIVLKLQMEEDFNSAILQVAGGLEILEGKPENVGIATLAADSENYLFERVRTQGRIVSMEKDDPFEGTATIVLRDVSSGDSLEVQIPYSAPWFKESFDEFWNQFSVGDSLTVIGGIDLYFTTVQLKPANWDDFPQFEVSSSEG